ncbi:hypothetical protein OBBRIDRAFT_793320 [Obba rivulosa]|uniref:RNA-binding protein VTS1 n=1 Tax=Obba rivulosa TaxID=1052685 RepID=A0A8E2B1E8_9APHY|nr:hypothetical protein OBBRIDRAFT_793320 [Obba rivulosa]
MSSLAPPSPTPSPGPAGNANGRSPNFRASMGPSARASVGPQGLAPASPRPGGISGAGRPTSELLGGAGMFQTPEAEAIDQWFETFQNYEVTLEEMAAASLDANFKEELSAIEQWFKVLSEAERTAALYSLLQHSTQVQIRFFITVLQQMARSDPMTALLSPAMGGSMQSQMEAKLASMNLKSPGLKSPLPASPTARNFSNNRPSLGVDAVSAFLSPDSAGINSGNGNDPATTLAQQRAKLKASNATHRISAPALGSSVDTRGWGAGSNQLAQVDERSSSPGQEISSAGNSASRPKSTDFSGVANAFKSPRAGEQEVLSPMVGDSWASMVNTPLMPMFEKNRNSTHSLDAAAAKLTDWTTSGGGVPLISDPPKKLNRLSKGNMNNDGSNHNGAYGDDGSPGAAGGHQNQRTVGSGLRNASGAGNNLGGAGWNGSRSPALSNNSGRFNEEAGMNGLGMAGFGMGMTSPGLGMGVPGAGGLGMAGFGGLSPMSPFGNMFNMSNLAAMGLSAEQLLAMQMAAAAGQLGQAGLGGFGIGIHSQQSPSVRSGRSNMRSPGVKSPSSRDSKKDDEDVDPKVLEDVPAWLRSLRLHKYTPNFENMNWKDMVMMDEAALEAKGVAALGARRKMLKTFEVVRKKMGIDAPASAGATSAST